MCSYDNFPMYGVAPYIATQWLASVSAAAEAAAILGDTEAEKEWREVLSKGTERLEATAWNGSYYRLYSDLDGPQGSQDDGVLSDQIIGEWAAHLADLPALLPPDHVRSALHEISRYRWRRGIANKAEVYFPDSGLKFKNGYLGQFWGRIFVDPNGGSTYA